MNCITKTFFSEQELRYC